METLQKDIEQKANEYADLKVTQGLPKENRIIPYYGFINGAKHITDKLRWIPAEERLPEPKEYPIIIKEKLENGRVDYGLIKGGMTPQDYMELTDYASTIEWRSLIEIN